MFNTAQLLPQNLLSNGYMLINVAVHFYFKYYPTGKSDQFRFNTKLGAKKFQLLA
jgi:hypothetical protein